jgi:ribosomal protein L11 methyltransferase
MEQTAWTHLEITVASDRTDAAAEIAHMVVPYGIYVEDYSDLETGAAEIARIDLIDGELLAKRRDITVIHLYLPPHEHPGEAIAFLTERFAYAGIAFQVCQSVCRNEDWENNWKAYFHPTPVGERLLIQPVWEDLGEAHGRAVLRLEPGLAFGSGSHETTRLCLELLETALPQEAALKTVLDIGCGSGILSVAALLLGAASALAVDIDNLAVENARENAERNGFAPPRMVVKQGDLIQGATGRYDVILSNIVADVIIVLAGYIKQYLNDGGVWICSGIIAPREADVRAAFDEHGLRVTMRKQQNNWLAFMLD